MKIRDLSVAERIDELLLELTHPPGTFLRPKVVDEVEVLLVRMTADRPPTAPLGVADAYSTAAFALGVEGPEWLRLDGCEAMTLSRTIRS